MRRTLGWSPWPVFVQRVRGIFRTGTDPAAMRRGGVGRESEPGTFRSAIGQGRPARRRTEVKTRRWMVVMVLAVAALVMAFALRRFGPPPPATVSGGLRILPVRVFTGPPLRWRTLRPGARTVILAMAPWCRYCAWEDRWVEPGLARYLGRKGIRLVIVDGSAKLGVATAGPIGQPGGGQDGVGPALTPSDPGYQTAVEASLAGYRHRYGVIVWANPAAHLKARWRLAEYPTFLFVNPDGLLADRITGVAPLPAIEAEVNKLGWAAPGI